MYQQCNDNVDSVCANQSLQIGIHISNTNTNSVTRSSDMTIMLAQCAETNYYKSVTTC